MKKILIIALAGVALTSCKKQTNPESVNSPNEINFTTSANLTKGLAVDYANNSNNFFIGDQIGVYMANAATEISNIPYTFDPRRGTPGSLNGEKAEAVNYGYTLSSLGWSPANANKLLTYPISRFAVGPNKAQLFAYFPFSGAQGSTVTQRTSADENKSVLDYTYKADQTKDEDLRNLDIMWTENTNNNRGFSASTTPIALTFNHLMTKLNFTIKLKGSETRYLRAIEVQGPEINVQPAELDVVDGTLKPATIQQDQGSVYYFNGSKTQNTFFTCTANTNGVTMTLADDGTGNPRTSNDLLIYPFTQTADKNSFLFYLTEDLSSSYSNMSDLKAAVKAGTAELYTAAIKSAVTTPGNEMFYFAPNINNVMTVTIDIDNPAISITATVKPWQSTAGQDIEAQ